MTGEVLALALSAIEATDGWDDDLDTGRVQEMSNDITDRRHVITPIGVKDMGDGAYRLVYGRHRLAAHQKAGAPTILALVLQHASPDEERAQVLAEALHRCTYAGPVRRKLIAEYLEVQARLPERAISPQLRLNDETASSDEEEKPRRGRPKGEVSKAAAKLGVSDDTVRRAKKEAKEPAPAKLVTPAPVLAPIETRLRGLANEVEAWRETLSALYQELAPTQHEARRLLDKAMGARAALQDAITGSAEAVEAGRSALRDAHKPSGETKGRTAGSRMTADRPEPYVPRKGLGGKRLRVEDHEGNPIEPADTQGEALAACGHQPDPELAPCAQPIGHEEPHDGEAF